MERKYSVGLFILVALMIGQIFSCSQGTTGSAPADFDIVLPERVTDGAGNGGGQFEDIHDRHADAGCGACHMAHGGMMPDNYDCLVCHNDDIGGKGNGGGHYADIHDQHADNDCGSCHWAHGGSLPDNYDCLVCHTDDIGKKHHDKWSCTKCHNGKGNRGNG